MPDKQRPRVPHSLEFYSFGNYLAYVLYPALYIAGPIMTFNDFMWQVVPSAPSYTTLFGMLTDSAIAA